VFSKNNNTVQHTLPRFFMVASDVARAGYPERVNPRVLVLGASGFVGRQVMLACQSHGLEVLGASRQAQANHVTLDPTDLNALRHTLETIQPTVIINSLGATTGRLPELVAANVLVVANLIETLPQGARLVHLGSAAEYGPVSPGTAIRPDAPTNPVSAYGLTKLSASQLLNHARAGSSMQTVVLRLFNVLGPGVQGSALPGAAVEKFRVALEHGSSVRFGSLEAFRDFVDVHDVAEALVLAATVDPVPPSVLNLGSGTATQTRDLIVMLAEVAGFQGNILEDGSGSPRPGDIPWQQANIDLTVSSLGWQPRWGLQDSLSAMWEANS
jgi:nucleoside-diphosphate-sugar epimerase